MRAHFTTCYGIEVFTEVSDRMPLFTAHFNTSQEMYHVVSLMRDTGISDSIIQDMTDYENTEEGKRAKWIEIIGCFVIAAVLILLVKLCL